MSVYFYGKHYEGETHPWLYSATNIKTIRLSDEELRILDDLYPGKSLSYAVRSLIHKADVLGCNTKNTCEM